MGGGEGALFVQRRRYLFKSRGVRSKGAFTNYIYKRRGVGGQKKTNFVNVVYERPLIAKLR